MFQSALPSPFGYPSPASHTSDNDRGDEFEFESESATTLHTPLSLHHPEIYLPPHPHSYSHSPHSLHFPTMDDDILQSNVPPALSHQASDHSLSFRRDIISSSFDSYFSFPSSTSNALQMDPFAATFPPGLDLGLTPPHHNASTSAHALHAAVLSYSTISPHLDPSLNLPPLPDFLARSLGDIEYSSSQDPSLLFQDSPSSSIPLSNTTASLSDEIQSHRGRNYSPRFPESHYLNSFFVHAYELGDELGSGGYGFVMTARHRDHGHEVAVKFIIKDKVPDHSWWQDDTLGRVPTEVLILSLLKHENIVKCLDLFDDDLYFYLVQELHGTPWVSRSKSKQDKRELAPSPRLAELTTPSLTPSPSAESDDSFLNTPPQLHSYALPPKAEATTASIPSPIIVSSSSSAPADVVHQSPRVETRNSSKDLLSPEPRPRCSRRPSYDLFECIEQSRHKRLTESQARYIFAQVVEAVHYLESQGISHCDIKDENLVIDKNFKVKLIDFGSAVVVDPSEPRPYYTLFFGTTAYAAPEILLKQSYLAAPAEIWTLGVLLSYLLTGHSPFPTEQDAIEARVVLKGTMVGKISVPAISLLQRCLEKDSNKRANIAEVRGHEWLRGALENGASSRGTSKSS